MGKITLKLWNKVKRFIDEYKIIKPSDRLLLAVSGGPDSMMLLHFFHKSMNNYFAVFHLNHMIRKESDRDEKIVSDYCKKNSIDFVSQKVDVKKIASKKKENLELVARRVRYDFLLKYAKSFKCNLIATAHTYDDNVETVLLNFFRGTDIDSLLGIPVVRRLKSRVYVVRPLLCVKKCEIIDYLKENKIEYAIDKTNFDVSYTRNWLRHIIIPEIEKRYAGFGSRIIKFSEKLKKIMRG